MPNNKVGRKKDPSVQLPAESINLEVAHQDSHALTELGVHRAEVAGRFDDGQSYARSRVVSEARFFMASSAEAMFELGKRLILIKQNELHGDFIEIVERRLGIPNRTASRFMAVALKMTSIPGPNRPALADLGRTKLFDLLDEPADDIKALTEGGMLAGLHLDDMQAMSSRELRAALVEARKKNADKDRVIAKKDEKLNTLAEAEERRRSASRDEREQAQLEGLRQCALSLEHPILYLVSMVDEVMQSPATEAAELAARQTLEYLVQRLADVCSARHLAIDVLGELVEPGWLRPIKDAVAEGLARKRPA